jgi:tetratricopeptide (TPR) repeat protein
MAAKSKQSAKKQKTEKVKRTPKPSGVFKLLSSPGHTAFIVFALSFVLYANTLGHEFVWDDRELILDNPAVRVLDGQTVQKIFLEDFWRMVQPGGGYYRPLVTLSYHVHYKIFNGSPSGFHLVNVVWNAIVCMLVFVFVRMLFRNNVFALITAVIFAVHPIHTENVAWISGRTDLLATLWSLVSLICYVLAKRCGSFLYLAAGLFSFMLALMAKESSACLPLIIAVLEFGPFKSLLQRRDDRKKGRARIPDKPSPAALLLYLAILIVYLLLRRDVIGTSTSTYPGYAPGALGTIGLPLSILAGYVFKLVFPFRLNGEYDAPVPDSFIDPHVLAGLAVLAILIFIFIRYRRRPDLTLGIAVFLLGLGPVSNLVPIGEISAERFLYLPSLGFALILGSLFASALSAKFPAVRQTSFGENNFRFNKSSPLPGVLAVVLVAVVAAFAVRTVTRNMDWKTDEILFAKTAEAAPNSYRALLGVGMAHQRHGRTQQAIEAYKKALEIKPDYADALSNLAGIYAQQRNIDEAARLLERALQAAPGSLQLLNNLGSIYFERKQFTEAAKLFERVIAIDPQQYVAQFNLGLIRFEQRNYPAARRHFELVAGKHEMFNQA